MLILLLILTSFNLQAQNPTPKATNTTDPRNLPLWEIGASVLTFRAPHYRSSPQHKDYIWPVPYFIIRGKRVQGENSFIRGNFYLSDRLSIDLSMNAGLNVISAENHRRQGMSNIFPSFEVGPMVRFFLWRDQGSKNLLNFEIPVRAAYATDFKDIQHIGFYNISYFSFASRPQTWNFNCSTELSAGPMMASKKWHDYYYGVSQQFEHRDRAAYQAKGGYSGFQLGATVTKRIGDMLFLPFLRYDILNEAVFDDSPLYQKNHYAMFGLGFVWFFSKSSKTQGNEFQVR